MTIKIKAAAAGAGGEGGSGFKGGDKGAGGIYDGEVDEVKSGAGGKGVLFSGLMQNGGSGGTLRIGTKGYLLAENRLSGHNCSLSDFSKEYGLSPGLKTKLEKKGYTNADSIRWLTTDDAKEMKLMKGEIASLKGALDSWSRRTVGTEALSENTDSNASRCIIV